MEKRIALTSEHLDSIKEMIDNLNTSISSMLRMMDATERAKKIGCDIGTALIYKNIEDGILKNLHLAQPYQIENLINGKGFKFRYYHELDNLLQKAETLEFVGVK